MSQKEYVYSLHKQYLNNQKTQLIISTLIFNINIHGILFSDGKVSGGVNKEGMKSY